MVMQTLQGHWQEGTILACTLAEVQESIAKQKHCKDKCHQIIAAFKTEDKRKKDSNTGSCQRSPDERKKTPKATTKQYRRKIGRNDEF